MRVRLFVVTPERVLPVPLFEGAGPPDRSELRVPETRSNGAEELTASGETVVWLPPTGDHSVGLNVRAGYSSRIIELPDVLSADLRDGAHRAITLDDATRARVAEALAN